MRYIILIPTIIKHYIILIPTIIKHYIIGHYRKKASLDINSRLNRELTPEQQECFNSYCKQQNRYLKP